MDHSTRLDGPFDAGARRRTRAAEMLTVIKVGTN